MGERGISGLISILFLIVASLIIFVSLYSLTQAGVLYIKGTIEREGILQRSLDLMRSVSGTYVYDPGSKTLSVNLTNRYGEPAIISRVLVIFGDGSAFMSSYIGEVIRPGESRIIAVNGVSSVPGSVIALLHTLSGTQASVPLSPYLVAQPPSYGIPSLSLVENNVIAYDDFLSDPISLKKIVPVSGTWSWKSGALVVSGTSTLPSGENVAYLNLTAYGYTSSFPSSVYVVTRILASDMQGSTADVLFSGSTSFLNSFYDSGVYFRNSNFMQAGIWVYTSRWLGLSQGQTISASLPVLLESYLAKNGSSAAIGSLVLASQQSYASYSDSSPLNVSYIGIGSYSSTNTSFDFIYVTRSRDPLYVYFTGIQQGYKVIVVDSSGNVYNATYDPSLGMFKAFIYSDASSFSPIIANATVLIYSGTSLVSAYYGDLMGGCVYSPPS
ncbi:MAG: hypothetical protein QW039_03175 [Fervidicoccaceae archaeon]